MKAAISTACFYPEQPEISVQNIKSAGVSEIEFFANSQSEYGNAYIEKFNEILKKNGQSLYSFHPFSSYSETFLLFSFYKRRVQDGMDDYKYQFEQAKKMGAQVFTFHGEYNTGRCDIDRYCEVYSKLYSAARDSGVIFAQENVAYCKAGRPEFISEMRKRLGDDIAFTLDIKQAGRAYVSPFEILKVMEGRIVNLHINDFSDTKSCLLPFAGTFDLKEFCGEISKSYKGPAVIEVYRENFGGLEELAESARRIEEL